MPIHARPVFVDRTGRRRRAFVLIGAGVGVLLVVSVVVLLAGLVTGAPLPVPGWPDSAQQKDQVVVVSSPTVGVPTTGPTRVVKPSAVPTAATPTTAPPAATPSTGNGNGNGHGRPTKSPGKP